MFRNSLGAWAAACVVAFGFASAMPAAAESDTVNKIKERGKLACGVGQGQRYGFSAPNDQGRWEGMDADYCRVVAAAILGGAGSLYGAVIGGLIVGLSENLSVMIIPTTYKPAVPFLLILVILYFRPEGLFGERK